MAVIDIIVEFIDSNWRRLFIDIFFPSEPAIYPSCLCPSFPHATDETLLAKFKQQHQGNKYFVSTPVMEPAFVIRHFAGKVKYQIKVTWKNSAGAVYHAVYKCLAFDRCITWTEKIRWPDSCLKCKQEILDSNTPFFLIWHWMNNSGVFLKKVLISLTSQDFREKNTDHMRPDIVALLRSSDRAYVRQLIGMDPVAMFRWGILRATIRGIAAFNEAGRAWAAKTSGKS